MAPRKTFDDLKELSTEIHHLNSSLSLLHWDQETFMPSGGSAARSQQISHLSALIHEKKTGLRFKNALKKALRLKKGLSKKELIMLREWHKDFTRLHKLPASFVKTFAQVTSEASQVWRTAKKENNFKLFAPFLEKIVELNREKAAILGFLEHPYDALLETYEPSMTTLKVTKIFAALGKELTALLKKIQKARSIENDFLKRRVAFSKQEELGKILLSKLPVESQYTRLDSSAHPFSTALHPHDSRITSRILPNNFMSHLSSILHETGHSLYEMGLPIETWGTPLSEAASLSVHESQSRWWETLIGRSLPFWKWFYPQLKKELPLLKKIPLEKFYRSYNRVSPSFIRVEADEVTYCLHVILRFEIEKDLISNKLNVYELPEAWNAKMKEYLGITPRTDKEGCLQDIHWSLGDFGYFPTYALGNLLAAQLFTAFSKDHKDYDERLANGDLQFIRDWLKTHVHQWGRTYNLEELAKKITGKSLSEVSYCKYLKKKYSDIYGF